METTWMKWMLIIELMTALMFQSAFAQFTVSGLSECYACSSLDTIGCGGDFDPNAEGVSTVFCGGYCYKTTYDSSGERVMDRGCEPSSDCPSSCFGNDCTYCCQGSQCNKATIVTSFPLLMCIFVGVATLKNTLMITEKYLN